MNECEVRRTHAPLCARARAHTQSALMCATRNVCKKMKTQYVAWKTFLSHLALKQEENSQVQQRCRARRRGANARRLRAKLHECEVRDNTRNVLARALDDSGSRGCRTSRRKHIGGVCCGKETVVLATELHRENGDLAVQGRYSNRGAGRIHAQVASVESAWLQVRVRLPCPEVGKDGGGWQAHLLDAPHAAPCRIDLQHGEAARLGRRYQEVLQARERTVP